MEVKIEIVKYAIQNLIHKAEQKYKEKRQYVSVIEKQSFTIISHI